MYMVCRNTMRSRQKLSMTKITLRHGHMSTNHTCHNPMVNSIYFVSRFYISAVTYHPHLVVSLFRVLLKDDGRYIYYIAHISIRCLEQANIMFLP